MLLACAALHAAPAAGQAAATSVAAKTQAEPRTGAVGEARACFERGQAAYQAGRLKEALAQFERAYALAPTPELDFDLGRAYERVGESATAARHFRAYLDRANVADAERKALEARIEKLEARSQAQLATLRAAPPSNAMLTDEARAFFERGQKLFREGRYRAALAAFAAARRYAVLPELAFNLALTSERLGQNAEAVDYYREYLREARDAKDKDAIQARIRALLTDRLPRPASP